MHAYCRAMVSAPALVKKSKKRLRNTSKYYPTIPNMRGKAKTYKNLSRRNAVLRKGRRNAVMRKRRFRNTSNYYPTIPNLPSPAITKFRTNQGMGGMRRRLR